MRSSSPSIPTSLWILAIVLLSGAVAVADSWVAIMPGRVPALQEITTADSPKLIVNGYGEMGINVSVDATGFALVPRKTKGGEFVEVTWPDASVATTS